MLSLTFLISTICVLQFALNLGEAREPQQNNLHENIQKFDNIIKFKFDDRKYQGLILENGLKVLLISDPFTNKSVASLSINFNAVSDSIKLKSVAFYSQYILYFGSKKYPEPDDFYNFLNKHEGEFNFYQILNTNKYFFEVNPNYLEPALDRFVQLFLSPIYNEVYIEKILKDIDFTSELKPRFNIQKCLYLDMQTLNPDYYKLFIANTSNFQEIFQTNTTFIEELKQFYSNYFSANMMSLVIFGKESIPQLYDMITKTIDFSKIKNKNIIDKNYDENLYKKKDLKKIIKIVTPNNEKEINLLFLIPDRKEYYLGQPLFYINYLIKDKRKGSLFFELKSKKFIYKIASIYKKFSRSIHFLIRFKLTEKGLSYVDKVINIIFQYFNMAKENTINKSIFDEIKYLKELDFNFKSKEDPLSFVNTISSNLHDFPVDKVIKNTYILNQYHPEMITEVLGYFRPDNMRVLIIAKNFEKDRNLLEDYFKIKYSYNNISEQLIQNWSKPGFNKNLKLPTRNRFYQYSSP